jgi:hypothetical protein
LIVPGPAKSRPRSSRFLRRVATFSAVALGVEPGVAAAFEFSSAGEVEVAPTDVVLEATTGDGGMSALERGATSGADFLTRPSPSEDGAFTFLGDRIRASVKRTRNADAGLGISGTGAADARAGIQTYRIEADLFRRGDLGLSAYGSYRQAAMAPAHESNDGFNRDSAIAGLNLGLGTWRSWLERRESPHDVAARHIPYAVRVLTYSTGLAYGGDRVKVGLSRSHPTSLSKTAPDPLLDQATEETRRAVDVTLAQPWSAGTTRLQLGRSITGAARSADETESTVRLSHQISAGPWRGEASLSLSTTRDDRSSIAFETDSYEIGAKVGYLTDDLPDLTARISLGQTWQRNLSDHQSDGDTAWQATTTIGVGKFLTGGVRDPSRFVDLNLGVRRNDGEAEAWGTPAYSATVGVNAGLRF